MAGQCSAERALVQQLGDDVDTDLREAKAAATHAEKTQWLRKWHDDKRKLAAARHELRRCLHRAPLPTGLYVRREAWSLQSANTFDPITLAYAKAVQVMQARPASDPTSWSYQGAIHGSYAAVPPGAPWNACQHRSWHFLSWHRMYLYYFERIVRRAVTDAGGPADFALLYWDYDRPFPGNTLPPAFRAPTLPDGTANPLSVASPRRSAGLMAGGQVPNTATSPAAALAETGFSAMPGLPSFGGGQTAPAHFGTALGALESTPHNVMHPLVGGAMSGQCQGGLMTDPNCAALDPIFWLHHANIDRLWNVWLTLGGGRTNPTESAWLTQSFEFRDETGASLTMTGADILDTAAQLGYVYDDAPAQLEARRPMAPAREREQPGPPELVAATEEPLVLAGGRTSARLTVPPSASDRLSDAAEGVRRTYVSIDDVEAKEDPGIAYAVYLEAPGGERTHVGNLSLFGIQEETAPEMQHGAPGFRHVFDATEALQTLRQVGAWDPASVKVTFEPIRILPPAGEGAAEEVEAPPGAEVRIGRVALFVG